MSAVNYFFSATPVSGQDRPYTAANSQAAGSLNMGTSTYASDAFELRITTGATNSGTYAITKKDVEAFLRLAHRWLNDSGGPGGSPGQGLDYLIKATSGTVGVP